MESKSMSDNKAATLGGSRVRPCDSCGVKKACWFCAADDAYLCHPCDTSVHSANSVSCKHERVKLAGGLLDSRSSWSRKRSRSDRGHKLKQNDSERQCKVPRHELDMELAGVEEDQELDLELGSLFSAGSHEEQEDQLCGLGLCVDVDTENAPSLEWLFDRVKVEVEDGDSKAQGHYEPFDLNVSFPDLMEEEEVKGNLDVDEIYLSNNDEKKICLKLNYEDVLSAWYGRGSPWADQNSFNSFLDDSCSEAATGLEYGVVPDLNAGSGMCEESIEPVPVTQYKSSGGFREARVKRYREKRRSRLFSKRIRYQVRKLNAEQRPRMKGRFVKKEPDLFSAHKHKR